MRWTPVRAAETAILHARTARGEAMIHPLDGSQTHEDEDRAERAAIIEEGNPGMSRAEADRLALRKPEQTPLPWRQTA